MAETLHTGPKARYNPETGEWDDLRPPTPAPHLEDATAPQSVDTLPIPTAGEPEQLETATTPETTPLPDEETIADQPNAEILYTDAELLGNRYPVRRIIHQAGNQSIRAAEGISARLKNTVNTPGKLRMLFSRNLAERRYNRQKEKLDSLSHLDDTHRLKQRRVAKFNRAAARLQSKQDNYNDRATKMKHRVDVVGEKAGNRHEQKISELKLRRDAALGRRAMRHEFRNQGASLYETHTILKDISRDHMTRVGSLAATAHVSERRATAMENVGVAAHDAKRLAQQHAAERDKLAKEISKA